MQPEVKTIVYVEDDADDREFLSDALRVAHPDVEIVTANNGLEAIKYLKLARNGQAPLPSLIILDINMPYLNGMETFQQIRTDALLQAIPLVVFTSSESPNDKAWFQRQGIELLTKPDNLKHLSKLADYMLSRCL
ncbi:MAG TPA: response regulator [Chitinophagaceae bacterium]|jgi:CheY-like chemotaxis protein|nr:response regulator [Chitinophagaceae bacterium]